ncbi:TatD family hydrolase [Allofustis seminis]|uniref:TatD family hydrolase n=1 Tax=Allofustis seminis TaxID=166939 RepID=UPI00036B8D61|nr:TatD family hydrolase [Allofustis seminis]
MHLIDTHTHLNVEEFFGKEEEMVDRAYQLGVKELVVVGFDEPTIEKAIELANRFDNIYLALGWHPTEAHDYNAAIEEKLLKWLQHEKVVAVGETGLDYHWTPETKERQEEVFRRHIQIAKQLNLPFTVHNRESTEDVYRIIQSEGVGAAGGIMHSFNLDREWLEKFLELGMHISYSGVVTFKNAPEVKASAKATPLERLLVETDAPYLSPEPYRGRRNEPSYTYYVAEEIAKLKGMSLEEFAQATTQTAKKIMKIGRK